MVQSFSSKRAEWGRGAHRWTGSAWLANGCSSCSWTQIQVHFWRAGRLQIKIWDLQTCQGFNIGWSVRSNNVLAEKWCLNGSLNTAGGLRVDWFKACRGVGGSLNSTRVQTLYKIYGEFGLVWSFLIPVLLWNDLACISIFLNVTGFDVLSVEPTRKWSGVILQVGAEERVRCHSLFKEWVATCWEATYVVFD